MATAHSDFSPSGSDPLTNIHSLNRAPDSTQLRQEAYLARALSEAPIDEVVDSVQLFHDLLAEYIESAGDSFQFAPEVLENPQIAILDAIEEASLFMRMNREPRSIFKIWTYVSQLAHRSGIDLSFEASPLNEDVTFRTLRENLVQYLLRVKTSDANSFENLYRLVTGFSQPIQWGGVTDPMQKVEILKEQLKQMS